MTTTIMSRIANREDFERWASRQILDDGRKGMNFTRLSDDRRYESMETETAWLAWSRRTLTAISKIAHLLEIHEDRTTEEAIEIAAQMLFYAEE